MTAKIAIVVPTIGRYEELRRMLGSLAAQSRLPDQVIIAGEGEGTADVAREFPRLGAQFLSLPGSSISQARNAGTRAARPDITLIGFMDDDIVLEPEAIEAMLEFWQAAPEDLGGASCNLVNYPPLFARRLKSLPLASRLGMYSTEKGAVLRSGIHTLTGCLDRATYARWLPTYAVVYARKVLEEFWFDEWFKGYSYLEDLDFSYRISKRYKLAIVPGARFYHYPSEIGRDYYVFGKKEVVNRLYFVRKHQELSLALCCVALAVRSMLSLFQGLSRREGVHFKRVAGNFAGLLSALTRGLKPVTQ